MNRNRNAFTLIELLVVISIIALLLAILMPSLGMVKEKARSVVCRSNLKQWGQIFYLYTNDHNGMFMLEQFGRDANNDGKVESGEGTWIVPLAPYYIGGNSEKLCLCPTTRKTANEGSGDPGKAVWSTTIAGHEYRNSYSINNWVYSRTGSSPNSWQKIGQRQESSIPMFLEGYRWGGGFVSRSAEAPKDNLQTYNTQAGRYCIDRHYLAVNTCFMDGHVDVVGLKGLWDLKWHKSYDTHGPLPSNAWPEWMSRARD